MDKVQTNHTGCNCHPKTSVELRPLTFGRLDDAARKMGRDRDRLAEQVIDAYLHNKEYIVGFRVAMELGARALLQRTHDLLSGLPKDIPIKNAAVWQILDSAMTTTREEIDRGKKTPQPPANWPTHFDPDTTPGGADDPGDLDERIPAIGD